jgi:hypothetical protein
MKPGFIWAELYFYRLNIAIGLHPFEVENLKAGPINPGKLSFALN